jgi:hypothetical protein
MDIIHYNIKLKTSAQQRSLMYTQCSSIGHLFQNNVFFGTMYVTGQCYWPMGVHYAKISARPISPRALVVTVFESRVQIWTETSEIHSISH